MPPSPRSLAGGGSEPTSFIDIRLLPVGIAIWLSEAAVLLLGGKGLFGVLIAAWLGVAVVSGCVLFWLHGLDRWCPLGFRKLVAGQSFFERGSLRQLPTVVTLTVISAVVGACLAGLRLAPLLSEPLASMGAQHAVVRIEARIDAPARLSRNQRPTQSWADGSQGTARNWSVPATLETVSEGDRKWTMSVPVLLLGSTGNPAELELLTPGSTVSASGSLREGDRSRGMALVVRIRGSPEVIGEPPRWQQVAAHIRESMRRAASGLGADERGLLPGLVVGDESGLSEDLSREMQQTGLSHLTAVSGANLAIITGLVLAVAALFRVRRWVAVLLAALALLGFVAVVGPQPSVLRAAAMGSVALLALVTGRRKVGISALSVSATALLVVDPWMSVSMGFALSVAATAGLLIYSVRSPRRVHGAGRPQGPGTREVALSDVDAVSDRVNLGEPGPDSTALIHPTALLRLRDVARLAVGVAVSAQLATLPLVASFGDGLPVVGVIANVLAEPAVPFATIVGCIAATVASIAPAGGPLFAHVAGFATWWIARVAHLCSELPAAVIPWPTGILGFGLACVLVAILLVGWARRAPLVRLLRTNPRGVAAVAAALIAISATLRATQPPWPPPGWLMVACDVGQGDALVLATRPGHAMVFDTGPDDRKVDRCLSELGVEAIDLLVISHFHADHVDGVDGAIAGRSVAATIVSPLAEPSLQYRNAIAALNEREIAVRVAEPGEEGTVGSLRYRVLWPTQILRGAGSAPNNASVAIAVELADPATRVLLTGDLEPAAQQVLLTQQAPTAFDVVKVPHHGSRNQSEQLSTAFPAAVALISVGAENRYGHPAASTIARWESSGSTVLRTDQLGDIAVGRAADRELFVVGHGPQAANP